jgi:hypothetical protein
MRKAFDWSMDEWRLAAADSYSAFLRQSLRAFGVKNHSDGSTTEMNQSTDGMNQQQDHE